jgi:peptidoglycan L-alanyl-D-glutamate endopeptidase CwlK
MTTLQKNDKGRLVRLLQQKLTDLGFDTQGVDGDFGQNTEDALKAYQNAQGLPVTGVADDSLLSRLGISTAAPTSLDPASITADKVAQMFPNTPKANIATYLPFVVDALREKGLLYPEMLLMALGTIRAETESFQPISEGVSKWNTSPGGDPFDLYDDRGDLENTGHPDGSLFKGRGFVQLTGRANYTTYSKELGLGTELVDNPDLANDPTIAAQLLAAFLKDKEDRIMDALDNNDLAKARTLVNGGIHGLNLFTDAYDRGTTIFV